MDDKEYFEGRLTDFLYVSKQFGSPIEGSPKKRFIQKKFLTGESIQFEETRVKGEYILRSSPKGKIQLKVVVVEDSREIESIVLQNFIGLKPQGENYSFRREEFFDLLEFLELIKFIDFANPEKYRIKASDIDTSKVLVDADLKNLIDQISSIKDEDRISFFENLSLGKISKEELDILSGRKKGLEVFRKNLFEVSVWTEPDWQNFFAENTWIFGYGLDYKFLEILRKEASVSGVDLDSRNKVTSDFLLGSNKFTVLVELKRPDTPLFTQTQNRAESWELSNHITHSVSQILAQKAEWEYKSRTPQFLSDGSPLIQNTWDPKTILVIGSNQQFAGETKEAKIKAMTFELYRRNSKNIEIMTYSELFERASFIVNQPHEQGFSKS